MGDNYAAREWIGVDGLLLSGEVEETDKYFISPL